LKAASGLKIFQVSAELTPLAKTGGLADVCAALPAVLHSLGHDIRVLLPLYGATDRSGLDIRAVPQLQDLSMPLGERELRYSVERTTLPGSSLEILLLNCPELYGGEHIYSGPTEHLRFIMLSRAAIEICQQLDFAADIFHCHDWHTALLPLYLKTRYAWDKLFSRTRTVLSIHNIGYQGIFATDILHDAGLGSDWEWLDREDLEHGTVNFLKTGVRHADCLTTVSPTYAQEIQTPEFGMGLENLLRQRRDSLTGILNGVDYQEWHPQNDALITHRFSAGDLSGKKKNKDELLDELRLDNHEHTPLIGMVTRLTVQKGIDLVQEVLPELMKRREFNLVVLGSGEARYEQFFNWLQAEHPRRVVFHQGFNNPLAHRIEAASDLFLMPSRYEPCGLNQMYSLCYGTVPLVRETGGLADSVQMFDPESGEGTGVVFRHYDAGGLSWALNYALDLYQDAEHWDRVVQNAMAQDYSWSRQVGLYVDLYRKLTESAQA
jgi:starch synthase